RERGGRGAAAVTASRLDVRPGHAVPAATLTRPRGAVRRGGRRGHRVPAADRRGRGRAGAGAHGVRRWSTASFRGRARPGRRHPAGAAWSAPQLRAQQPHHAHPALGGCSARPRRGSGGGLAGRRGRLYEWRAAHARTHDSALHTRPLSATSRGTYSLRDVSEGLTRAWRSLTRPRPSVYSIFTSRRPTPRPPPTPSTAASTIGSTVPVPVSARSAASTSGPPSWTTSHDTRGGTGSLRSRSVRPSHRRKRPGTEPRSAGRTAISIS